MSSEQDKYTIQIHIPYEGFNGLNGLTVYQEDDGKAQKPLTLTLRPVQSHGYHHPIPESVVISVSYQKRESTESFPVTYVIVDGKGSPVRIISRQIEIPAMRQQRPAQKPTP